MPQRHQVIVTDALADIGPERKILDDIADVTMLQTNDEADVARRGPDADILLVPDLEAGNMLAKQLVYLAEAEMAGVVLGARAPIMLTSRADNTIARLGSCAIALILARNRVAQAP